MMRACSPSSISLSLVLNVVNCHLLFFEDNIIHLNVRFGVIGMKSFWRGSFYLFLFLRLHPYDTHRLFVYALSKWFDTRTHAQRRKTNTNTMAEKKTRKDAPQRDLFVLILNCCKCECFACKRIESNRSEWLVWAEMISSSYAVQ